MVTGAPLGEISKSAPELNPMIIRMKMGDIVDQYLSYRFGQFAKVYNMLIHMRESILQLGKQEALRQRQIKPK